MPIVIAIVAIILVGVGAYVFTSGSAPNPEPTNVTTETPATEELVTDTSDSNAANPESINALPAEAMPVAETGETTELATAYVDGSYTADAFYLTPRRTRHDMAVTLTIADGVVTAAAVTYDGGPAATPNHSNFDAAYKAEVIGKPLEEISLSRVGGASLTSDAFNEAVAEVKNQAAT